MAGTSLFANFGRAAKVLALLLFFLPWVTVSCSADGLQRLQAAEQGRAGLPPQRQVQLPTTPDFAPTISFAQASGFNMAVGSVQLTLPDFGATGPSSRQPREAPSVAPEIGVIVGATLILVGLIATFLGTGLGFAIGAGSTLLAVGAFCFSVFVHYPPAAIAAVASSFSRMGPQSPGATPPNVDQLTQIMVVRPAGMFYFLLVLLVAAAVLDIMAMKKTAPRPETVF